jgi:hypothetical protein
MKKYVLISFLIGAAAVASAQIANPAQPIPGRTPATAAIATPAQMRPVGAELNAALTQLETAAQRTSNDIGRLSIRKWKADSAYKEQSQHDADSIQANTSGMLAQLVAQVRANPDNVATFFKLYRNVDAFYDVLKTLTESAGAFGPKKEYEALDTDSRAIANSRNTLAMQLDALASNKEAEISLLRTQVAQARAAAAASTVPPKKIIIDDTEPAKKVVKKKVVKHPVKKEEPKGEQKSQAQTPPK